MLRRLFWFGLLMAVLLSLDFCASADELTVTFFNAGKADACLLQTSNSTVLIDTGRNKFGKELAAYFKENGIEEIDVLFITHFDKDHVGGADTVLENVRVHTVYEPAYTSDSKQYTQYREALDTAGMQAETLEKNIAFELDGVQYIVDVANERFYGEDEENDFSLVIAAAYGDTSFLFAGDAENPRLGELLSEDIGKYDVLKVPHHGRAEKLSASFFQAVRPPVAVITSDEDEPEETAVVNMLRQYGQVYLTRLGNVICTTDGETISVSQK